VVPALFDPYRSSLVAPDHLLFGLGQDVLRGTIALCSPQARNIADVLMRRTISCNFLRKKIQIIYPASASINAMGMSDLFAIFLIAPICFENALHLDGLIREEMITVQTSPWNWQRTQAREVGFSHAVYLTFKRF
jgi:hypothetical protein